MVAVIGPIAAHEMRPAIADLTVSGDAVEIRVDVNLEAITAGIDQRTYEDTNDAPAVQAQAYDRLRALDAASLDAVFRRDAADNFVSRNTLRVVGADGAARDLPLTITAIEIGQEDDPELPRTTTLTMTAPLPEDGRDVIFGWTRELGPLILRQMGVPEDDAYTGFLIDGVLSEPISVTSGSAQSAMTVFIDYIGIGFQHIIPKGLDHILFVLGLFFMSLRWRPLLYQVTAFTLAHTVTLALATLGIVSVPSTIVEPMIAASIVFVAVENIVMRDFNRWRPLFVFGFGLLHGLGFATVLGDVGLNPTTLLPSLIGFNIGVELGQLAVIACAFFAVGVWFGKQTWYRQRVAIPASLMIAAVGAYWFVERVFL